LPLGRLAIRYHTHGATILVDFGPSDYRGLLKRMSVVWKDKSETGHQREHQRITRYRFLHSCPETSCVKPHCTSLLRLSWAEFSHENRTSPYTPSRPRMPKTRPIVSNGSGTDVSSSCCSYIENLELAIQRNNTDVASRRAIRRSSLGFR
jgi:hypothetical protein